MANVKELVVKLIADASGYDKGTKKAVKDNEDIKKSSSGLKDGFVKGMGAAVGFIGTQIGINSVASAIGSVKDYMEGAVQGALDMQAAQADTNRILSSGTHVAGLTGQAVDALSTKYMNQTGVDDDVIRGAENILAGYNAISNKAFPDVTKAALDMARAQANATGAQMDANGAARALGIAMQDPAKGARLLRTYGIALTQQQQDAITTAEKQGDTMKAQGLLLDIVKNKVGGASDAYKNTAAGGIQTFQTALGNIQKTIGTAILPILTDLLNKVAPIAQQFAANLPNAIKGVQGAFNNLKPPMKWISDNGDTIKAVLAGLAAGGLAVLTVAIYAQIPAMVTWAATTWAAAAAWIALNLPLILIVGAIALVVAGVVLLIQHWKQVSAFLGSLGGKIKEFVGNALGKIGEFIGGVIAWFQSLPGKIWGFITQFTTGLMLRVGKLELDALKKFGDLIGGIVAFFQGLPGKVWTWIESTASGILTRIGTLELNALNKVRDLISGIVSNFQSLPGKAMTALENLKSAALGKINDLKSMFQNGLNNIKNFFTGLILKLPHINLPHFSITGSLSINPPSVPHLDIQWYRTGGIFTGPQVIGVGEAGPEAVIPLDRLSSAGGGNGGGSSNGQPVNIQLDGRTIVRAFLPYLVDELRRSGAIRSL